MSVSEKKPDEPPVDLPGPEVVHRKSKDGVHTLRWRDSNLAWISTTDPEAIVKLTDMR